METIPPKAVWAVVAALIGLAGLGAFQGWQRGAADQQAVEAGVLPSTASVAGAKNASPLSEPLNPGLSEAQVREIARQEVRSVLGRSEPSGSSESAAERAAAAPTPRPPPVLAPPPTPPTAPGANDAGQPPLF